MLYTACPEKHGMNHYLEPRKDGGIDSEFMRFINGLVLLNVIVEDFDDPTSPIKYCQYKDAFGHLVEHYSEENRYYFSDDVYKTIELGAYNTNSIWLDKGKYIVVRDPNNCILRALRYGELWNDTIIGDNLIYQLCSRIDELEESE